MLQLLLDEGQFVHMQAPLLSSMTQLGLPQAGRTVEWPRIQASHDIQTPGIHDTGDCAGLSQCILN